MVWAGQDPEFPWTEEDPDADFRVDPDDTADSLIALYRGECEASRRIAAESGVDDVVAGRRGDINLRWLMVHMIEESARHAGHADLIREMVDGTVGH